MERSAVVTGERAQAYRAALIALRDDRETSEVAVA
jgi:hypothetical protein